MQKPLCKAVNNIAQHSRLLLFKIKIKVTNILEMVNTGKIANMGSQTESIRLSKRGVNR